MDAVLFDMDGLLVDTEHLWFEVETEVVERLGGTWGPQHQAQLVGGSWERAVDYMLEFTQADVDPVTVAEWLVDGMVSRLAAGATVMPGALELLEVLAEHGIRTALVTSSVRVIADAVLSSVGRAHFEVVVTADDVVRTKPHPEPYLTAARLMSADPRRCVALEDSPTGVASASAAGCRVVAVPSVLPVAEAPGRLVMPSLVHVDVDLLRSLIS